MKILHVTQNYFPSVGGSQQTIKKVSEYLHEKYNDDINVYTTNSYFGPHRRQFKKIEKKEETINGINIKRFPFARFHKPFLKLSSKLSAKGFPKLLPGFFPHLQFGPLSLSMFRAINASDAEVIGASSIHYLFADYPIWRKYFPNPKPFVMYGALHLHNAGLSKQYKKRIAAADYYIANTFFEKKYLIDEGFEEEKIKIIGTATDVFSFADFSIEEKAIKEKHKLPPEKFIITFIGRQETSKGLPLLLNAFSILSETFNNICLLIAGASGTYTRELQIKTSVDNNIFLMNDISDREKADILRITDVFTLASSEESFGVVFIEAWSFSKPVIGADINAIASLVEDGKDGLLFESGNAKSLAAKIEILLKNETLRKKMGENGFKKFKENYTWDIVADKYKEVYESAIKKFHK
jgi:glycosyltransferase involved in cell wall biosynthesis